MPRLLGRRLTLGLLVLISIAPLRAQLTFTFDYSLDSGNFFSGANEGRRQYLEAVGTYVSQYFTATTLSAINPAGANSWNVIANNPANPAATLSLGNLSVPANTVVVYAGGAALGGSVLAQAGPAGYSASGDTTWVNQTVQKRDLSLGAYARTAVGSLAFNSSTAWYFDPTPQANASFTGQYDFFSVAAHELLHVLGFGITETAWGWKANLFGGTFNGSRSLDEKSDAQLGILLNSGIDHWAQNTVSFSMRDGTSQEALMDPDIAAGVRKYLTSLDLRAMQDIGYVTNFTAVPEPSTYAFGAGVVSLVWAWRRRRRRAQS
jgi:hypothetical protein